MPGVVAKAALREAIEEHFDELHLEGIADLMHRPKEGSTNVLDVWWKAFSITLGSLELAYRRGYRAGCEDAEAKDKKK